MPNLLPFEETRPYVDSEVPAAIERIAASPYFDTIIQFLYPSEDIDRFKTQFKTISTVRDFQEKIMNNAIQTIIQKTSNGLFSGGFNKISNEHKGMFISNHRDILLDAALLQLMLRKNNMETSEITFGSNLMQDSLVIDIGKINKMFRIVRGGNIRDFYKNSMEVSQYMRYAITQKKQSTWIAQRNGRTKNGDDKTEMAVLKMFAMSSKKPFVENLLELNIMPISISYEYEPCDFLKTAELYVSSYQKYVKAPNEDLNSILHGIQQFKGKISLVVCEPIGMTDLREADTFEKNEKFQHLAEIIDKRIYAHYKLWKTNYIAFDLLHHDNRFAAFYSEQEKQDFTTYMNNGINAIQGDKEELTQIFLTLYANPIKNVVPA